MPLPGDSIYIDSLGVMLHAQREFQRRLNGYDVNEQTDEQRIANFKESMLALCDELHEALGEMGWKSWASSNHFNRQRVQEELVDAWHFFMNLMLHADMSADDLTRMYGAKLQTNYRRQDEGYDGVSGKCPQCKRDLLESGTREKIAGSTQRVDIHCVCGAYLGSREV